MNQYGIPPPLPLPTGSMTKASLIPPFLPAFTGAPLHPRPLDTSWGPIPAFSNPKGAGSEAQGCVEEARSRWRMARVRQEWKQAAWQYTV